MPLGTVNAEELNDPARPPLMIVLQGRWVTGNQLDSGHLLLQDDQPDGHIGACRAFACTSARANGIVQVHDHLLAAVARLNERAEPSRSLQRPQNVLISLDAKVVPERC